MFRIVLVAVIAAALCPSARGQETGSIQGWGAMVVLPQGDIADLTAIAAGSHHSLGLRLDGSIAAWGSNSNGKCNVPAPNTDFTAVAAGWGHSLGLRSDGSIAAWGANGSGQLNVPAPNTDFIAIAGGWEHSLGLRADGSIAAWGSNGKGQCNVPAPNSGHISIAAGELHSLGLRANGSIAAWGSNSQSQINVPAPNAGFIAIAAGGRHNVGLRGTAASGSLIYAQSVEKNSPPYEGLPEHVLGPPDEVHVQFDNDGPIFGFVDVGFGGHVISNHAGPEIFIYLVDWLESYEGFYVYASMDAIEFELVGAALFPNGATLVALDLAGTPVGSFRYLRIQNASLIQSIPYEGPELDAIAVQFCYANCDASGALNIDDFLCFQLKFALGDSYADCDGNQVLNIDDFLCFQLAFALGC